MALAPRRKSTRRRACSPCLATRYCLDHFFDSDATEALVASTRFKTRSADKSIDVHLASEDGVPFQWLVGATALAFDQRQDIDVSTQVPLGFLVPGAPLTTPLPGGLQFLLGGNVSHALGRRVHRPALRVYSELRAARRPALQPQPPRSA